jgi:hypothetical protein
MGNKPAGYWILVLIAIIGVVVSLVLRSSADPHTREISKYLGYGGLALLLIGRIFFRPKVDTAPPIPRD